MDEYPAPASEQVFHLEIKRSRFMTSVVPVTGKDAAKTALQRLRNQYPDANHHCWAMVAGHPHDVFQQDQSDDGEPKGTAGKPMLNVLAHSGFGNTLTVVTRYFGGVKLGAGGLVRAYSQSVSEALAQTKTVIVQIRVEMTATLDYSRLDELEHRLAALNVDVVSRNFTESVELRLAYPEPQRENLNALLMNVGATVREE